MGRPLPLPRPRWRDPPRRPLGHSKAGAQAALQDELRQRAGQQRTEVLKPNSRFREAADVWMGKIRERRADSTADTYASCLRNQVLPQLGELRLSECDTAHLARSSPGRPPADTRDLVTERCG